MENRSLSWWFAVGTAAAPAVLLLALVVQCPSFSTEVSPGSDLSAPHCADGLAPQLIVFVPLCVLLLAGVLWRRADVALAGAVLFVGLAFLFGFSMGFLIPLALVHLVAVVVWCRRAWPSDPTPGVLALAIPLGLYASFGAVHAWSFAGLWLMGSVLAIAGGWLRERRLLWLAAAVFLGQAAWLGYWHSPLITPLSLGAAGLLLLASLSRKTRLTPTPPSHGDQ